ncbi:hypothetical protein GIB67_020699 [Kingdonia uniflora]|uniref:Aminotransferase-like plant mobile domain-containing protein n=1 Tax=Kingdonia uniflora TaxID=39325 RepID=A0A7J7NJY2_9MAGN|nr:hypothetical protein GIB67_020699 [Kingdonia uniflora]
MAREGDLLTYKRKRKTIDPSTVVPPNTVDTANEGVSKPVPPTEFAQATLGAQDEPAQAVNSPQGLKFETKFSQAALGAQPLLPNVSPNSDVNIHIVGGYSEGEGATSNEDEKLPIRVYHHQSTWDLTKEPKVVQYFLKFKGLDRIGAISYNSYNIMLIYAFVECWQPETNSFHFKWGEMTPTLDDVKQLVGLPADGDATVIGGTWGFPVILEVFQSNLLQNLNAFKSLKAGGTGNSLSLKKQEEHYAYKLEKVLSDDTAAAAKKKELTTRSIARAYMLYVLGSFLFPMKKGTDFSVPYLDLFAKAKVAKKWSWGSAILAHMYYYLGVTSRDDGMQFACCTTLLKSWIFAHFPKLAEILKEMDSDIVWDPYRDKRDSAHTIKEVTFFYGALASRNHVQPYYPNSVVRQFNREQGIPAKRLLTEVSNLWTHKRAEEINPKYEWVDCFSAQKWKEFILKKVDRGQRVRERPLVCTEGYLEWFASVSWTTICPIAVDLAVDDDVGIHQRKEANVNENGDTPVYQYEDYHEHASLSLNAHDPILTRDGSGGFDQQITTLNDQLQKLKEDKEKESEANINLREALKEKISYTYLHPA